MKRERPPSFQFYPRQFAADEQVMMMDLDAVGAHIILMCAAAASPEGYRIYTGAPTGELRLRNLLRRHSEEDWKRIREQLLFGAWKVSEDGLWWEQDGLKRTLQKQKEFSDLQRQRVTKRYTGRVPEGYQSDTESHTEAVPKSYSSSSSSILNPPTPLGSKPEGFNASEVAIALCNANGITGMKGRMAMERLIQVEADNRKTTDLVAMGDEIIQQWTSHKATGKFPQSFTSWVEDGGYKPKAKPKKRANPGEILEQQTREQSGYPL